jgi:pimeloyl-ACP methyl ester carboxylesterase
MPQTLDLTAATIEYEDTGSPGPTVLFVHGLLVDGTLWRKVVARLDGYRCIVPTLPLGSHRIPVRDRSALTPNGVADMVAELMDRLDLNDVTIVANDTGGAISQILASERPQRLRALVLTNCDCLENFLPPILRPLQWLAHVPGAYWLLAQAARSARIRRSPLGFGMLSHRPLPDELTADWLAALRQRDVRADVLATLKAIDKRDTLNAAQALSERPLPTLLAWGPDDRMFPLRFAERLAAMIPDARLEQIADSRAFAPQDQPLRLAALIDAFVSRQNAVASSA